jgi:hypothetical protein
MASYFVGVDLGQQRDFTAIAVVERAELPGEWDAGVWAYRKEVALRLRYLERVALGTPYPEVADRVTEVMRSRKLAGHSQLIVDGTGVGAPMVDLLRREEPARNMMAATITGGERESYSNGYYRIPKRDLIVGLQVLLQDGELQIARRIPFREELMAELSAMQVKVTAAGHEKYEAWREGTHDDLVFAVALACWGAGKAQAGSGWWTNRDGAVILDRGFKRVLG